MRICIITPYFTPSIGGVETYTEVLAEYLAAHECEVSVITSTPAHMEEERPYAVHRGPTLRAVVEIMRDADVVQVNALNLGHCVLARMVKRPLVWAHFDYPSLCPKGIGWWKGSACGFGFNRCVQHMREEQSWPRVARMLAAYCGRRIGCWVVDRNIIGSAHGMARIGAPKSVMIPLGIRMLGEPAYWGCDEEPRKFLFIGRHISEKGGDVLIRALAELRKRGVEATVTLCGNGPEASPWKALAAELAVDGWTTFAGPTQAAELERQWASCVAVIVPSRNDEYVGLVALESMCRGKLVIAADTGGLGDIVREAGLAFRVGDPEDLARRMEEVLARPDWARGLGIAARRVVAQKYSVEVMGARYLEVYRQLAGRAGRQQGALAG